MKHAFTLVAFSLLILSIAACNADGSAGSLHIRVIADGRERAYVQPQPVSVGQFLQRENVAIGDFDKIYPPPVSPLTDNMVITIIRVTEREDCLEEDIPYERLEQKTTALSPNENRVIKAGVNGRKKTCYRVVLEDNVEKSRIAGNPTVLTPPSAEIVAVGVDNKSIEPIPINGLIAYISGDQALAIESNSVSQRILPTGGGLDGRVFALSETGRQLLYTRTPAGSGANGATATPNGPLNELWVLLDTADTNAKPVKLLNDVLYADWVPNAPYTISYSTGQKDASRTGGYQAFNDLIIVQLNNKTGQLLKAKKLVSNGPTGLYSWWGTQFKWSPDGKALAWAQADAVGTVDVKTGKLQKLFDFKVYSTTLSRGWVWVPSLAWSSSGALLAATVHGSPEGGEPPETSPVFDLALASSASNVRVNLAPKAGLWARPQFSPLKDSASGDGSLAYLRARDGINSLNSEYDLVVADRDGSNAEAIFPGSDKQGLKPVEDFNSDLVWSADGRQLLCIYQGNLWLIDVTTRRANQLTVVENARLPRWVR